MSYILIIVFLSHYGNATSTAEFSTHKACTDAAKQVAAATSATTGSLRMVCAPKGDKP